MTLGCLDDLDGQPSVKLSVPEVNIFEMVCVGSHLKDPWDRRASFYRCALRTWAFPIMLLRNEWRHHGLWLDDKAVVLGLLV